MKSARSLAVLLICGGIAGCVARAGALPPFFHAPVSPDWWVLAMRPAFEAPRRKAITIAAPAPRVASEIPLIRELRGTLS